MITSVTQGKMKRYIANFIKYLILILFAVTTIYPFFWVIISSLKSTPEIYAHPFSLPEIWRFDNYVEAFKTANIDVYFANSLIVSVIAVAALLLISAMASYILARKWQSQGMYLFFTLGIMIPIQTLLIPSLIIYRSIGIVNKRPGLILIYIVYNLSISIFILVGFMKTLPKELEEAALIDGCGLTMTFFRIIFPLSKAGLSTIGILAFLNCWNDYLLALIFISDQDLKTLTQGIYALQGQHTTNYGLLCAGLLISIIPVIIMYLLFQNQVIEGMTAGAVKG